MEWIEVLIKSCWLIVKTLLTSPQVIIMLILVLLMKIYYPKFRGYMGEFWVKLELKKLPKEEYIVLNDIMLNIDNSTHQIDHIVLSKYGIFVIEMKNYYGLISGSEYKDKWTQYLGKNKFYFKNPIHQNYGHIKALSELLKIDESYFTSIICFSNQSNLKVSTNTSVIILDELNKEIQKYNMLKLYVNINEISNLILNNNIKDKIIRKEHIANIKKKIKNEKMNEDNMICPKCNSKLIEKQGRYGKFIGCSNYPNCKYIKK